MAVNSRASLENYCLRMLGHPVIEVNVAPEQVSDRIDDALQFYFDFHYDGIEKKYFVYEITDADVTNGYITLTDNFFSVIRIVPATSNGSISGGGLFDVRYQIHFQDFMSGGAGFYSGGNLQYWEGAKMHMELLNELFNPEKAFEFNRKTNKIYLHQNIGQVKKETPKLLIETYATLDPEEYTEIYDDWWLKRYATALIKQQWGSNLKKYQNFQLPGGITLNADAIYNEATAEVEEIRREVQENLQLPVNFFIG